MTPPSDGPVRLTRNGAVATLVYDRPEGRNSFDVTSLRALRGVVQGLVDDRAVRAVVLTGSGRTFFTGADVAEMRRRAGDAARLFDELTLDYHALIATMRRSETVFVAAVNGVAAGGGVGLALATDLIVMARSARLVTAYGNLGISPDGGVTQYLVQTLGPHRARELLLVDDGVSAEQAAAWGLANRVVDDAALMDTAHALATRAAARSRHTVREAKRLVELAGHSAPEVVLEAEREAIIRGGGGADFQEGLEAFFAKRAPRFD